MVRTKTYIIVLCAVLWSCSGGDDYEYTPTDYPDDSEEPVVEPEISDEELLNLTQEETFKYFWDFAEVNTGCARERYHPDDPTNSANVVTTGGTGFGLMALIVGIERGFITREEGVERFDKMLDFLDTADRFHGAWPHWINGTSGEVIPFSTEDDGGDLVETAFLAQGLICVYEYFKEGSDNEKLLAEKANTLWKGVEWDWYTQDEEALYWHWSPNYDFSINMELTGYNEVLIAYVMAAASPDYSINKEDYTSGWASNGGITSSNTAYGYPLLVKHNGAENYGGPLFWSHYSYLGLNPKELSDDYVSYWNVNINHTKINYNYCVENPNDYEGYGEDCWGLTASYSRNSDGTTGYAAHKPENDLGVISPTAAISAMPYTPDESIEALHYFYENKDRLLGVAGFYDAFSPEYDFWVAEAYLAIDQGPQIIMIENYRTGLLWDLFMQNSDVQFGLDKLGFSYAQN